MPPSAVFSITLLVTTRDTTAFLIEIISSISGDSGDDIVDVGRIERVEETRPGKNLLDILVPSSTHEYFLLLIL